MVIHSLRRRRSVVLVTAIAGIAVLAACSSSGGDKAGSEGGTSGAGKPADSGSSYVILNITATSGPSGTAGKAATAGITAAAKYLNDQGGVLGHHVDVVTMDDQGDAATGTNQLVNYLSSHPTPQNCIAGGSGLDNAALITQLAKKKIFCLFGADSGLLKDGAKYPLLFTTAPDSSQQIIPLVDYIKAQNVKKIGIFQEDEAFEKDQSTALEGALKGSGIDTSLVTFPADALDVSSQLSQLKSSNPELVAFFGFQAPAGYAVKARQKLGWNVPFIGDIAVGSTNVAQYIPASALVGVKAQTFAANTPDGAPPGTATMLKYLKETGTTPSDTLLSVYAANGWDPIIAGARVATMAGTLDPEKMAAAIGDGQTVTDKALALYGDSYTWKSGSHEIPDVDLNKEPVVPLGPIVNGQFTATS